MINPAFLSASIVAALKRVAADMESHVEELRELDARIGDGDLGVTIELSCRALRECLDQTHEEKDVGQLLTECGWSINKASPSTFGTLLASAYLGAGKAVSGKESISKEDLVSMAEGAIEGIKRRGKADVGDKTMLDCLVPAASTFKKEVQMGRSVGEALEAAVTAAEQGLQSTINMTSKHGRASWQGEKAVGVQDAGATAIYYMLRSMARHLTDDVRPAE